MAVDNSQKQKTFLKTIEESDLSLEVVILIVFGVFMFILGALLFKIQTGALPYTPDSTYGLFLVIVSFQVVTMGKTPFGDLRRSWALIIIGIITAILGMTASFIPGFISEIVRSLVGIILLFGGTALLLQLFISEGKARTWMKFPGILQQLTIACALVYTITIISGLVTLLPGITTNTLTAIILMIYGISFFYLSWCIQKASKQYPSEETENPTLIRSNPHNTDSERRFSFLNETSLPLSFALIIMLGVLITLLGSLLIPVNLGLIPFSPDGQLGLLLVIIAIQMMALGDTPIGPYQRSWLLIIIGIIFASFGIVSCIVPGILTGVIQILIGSLNIIGGVLLLIKRFLPMLSEIRNPPTKQVTTLPTIKKLIITQTVLNFVAIAFGLTMLLPSLVPGLIIAGILIINGLLLFVLTFILNLMTRIQLNEPEPVSDTELGPRTAM